MLSTVLKGTLTNKPTLKGKLQLQSGSGKDGVTPHIGENGNWFIGEEDTGVRASGMSAYEVACIAGFRGTEEEWLESLTGKSGVYVGEGEMPEGYNIQVIPSENSKEAATKEYVDSAIANIDIPTGGTWRKIIDFNIEEDSSSVEFENDMEGKPIMASKLFAMITLAVPTDEAWKSTRKFTVSPYLARDNVGGISMWFSGYLEITPVTTYSGTAPTHTGVLMEIIGENMATGQIWNSYNNSSIPDRLVFSPNNYTLKTNTLQYLKQPYANGFNMTSYQIVFPAGSRLQVWAIDYVGEE